MTKNVDVFNLPFFATDVVLYQSVFDKDGVHYKELYCVHLKAEE